MFNIGQHVKARWTNGEMYGAHVQQFNGTHYLVAWDDGAEPLWVAAHEVQPEGGGQFVPGQHVQAVWTNGRLYGARVQQSNGTHYEVAWDDGSPPLWVPANQVQPDAGGGGGFAPAAQFVPGQHVQAVWTNGRLYGARIQQFNGTHYEVAWDDGSPPLWVPANQVQPDAAGGVPVGGGIGPAIAGGGGGFAPAEQFSAGQHVQAVWTNGRYYGARVRQSNGTHYEVAWDDGSPPLWVPANQVQPDAAAGVPVGGGVVAGGGGDFQLGEHVLAQWTTGQMYGARINGTDGSRFEVAWDDGSPNLWLEPHQIRRG